MQHCSKEKFLRRKQFTFGSLHGVSILWRTDMLQTYYISMQYLLTQREVHLGPIFAYLLFENLRTTTKTLLSCLVTFLATLLSRYVVTCRISLRSCLKFIYRISANSCRDNYSFFGLWVRQLIKGDNYSKEETINFYLFLGCVQCTYIT